MSEAAQKEKEPATTDTTAAAPPPEKPTGTMVLAEQLMQAYAEPAEDKPAAPAEGEAAKDKTAADAPPGEQRPEPEHRSRASVIGQIRRELRASERRGAELTQRLQVIEAERAQSAEQLAVIDGLQKLFAERPEEAVRQLARRAGMTETELYRRLAGQETKDGGATGAVERELAEIKQQIQAEREERQKERTKLEEDAKRRDDLRRFGEDVKRMAELPAELCEQYPHFAALPVAERQQIAAEGLAWAIEHNRGEQISLDHLVAALDKREKDRYEVIHKGIQGKDPARHSDAGGSAPRKSDGPGNPADRAKPGGPSGRTPLSNATEATAGARRAMTDEESKAILGDYFGRIFSAKDEESA